MPTPRDLRDLIGHVVNGAKVLDVTEDAYRGSARIELDMGPGKGRRLLAIDRYDLARMEMSDVADRLVAEIDYVAQKDVFATGGYVSGPTTSNSNNNTWGSGGAGGAIRSITPEEIYKLSRQQWSSVQDRAIRYGDGESVMRRTTGVGYHDYYHDDYGTFPIYPSEDEEDRKRRVAQEKKRAAEVAKAKAEREFEETATIVAEELVPEIPLWGSF